jgi:hypothetical protein
MTSRITFTFFMLCKDCDERSLKWIGGRDSCIENQVFTVMSASPRRNNYHLEGYIMPDQYDRAKYQQIEGDCRADLPLRVDASMKL